VKLIREMQVCFSDRTRRTVPNRDRTPAGFRDATLIAILRGAGLRRAEVVQLNMSDFNDDGEIKIRCGKGRVDF
jgi:site-specific recombinase XerD